MECVKTYQGHLNSIAAVAFHPKNPVIATVSDDEMWKLWSIPNCELIMSGEGHRDWIAGIEFHPRGTHIATASGDNTIKIWDFVSASCTLTLQDHAHPVAISKGDENVTHLTRHEIHMYFSSSLPSWVECEIVVFL
jgi:WD40 repeat protein